YADVLTPERLVRMQKGIRELRAEYDRRNKWLQALETWNRKRQEGIDQERAEFEHLKNLYCELWPVSNLAPPPREKK
ncbi:MAG TPA: hypothetical protein VM533_00975, partial [Fimbriiglobus sp.]|nr:hypothetical protein [Fimbriiglobus sp.]